MRTSSSIKTEARLPISVVVLMFVALVTPNGCSKAPHVTPSITSISYDYGSDDPVRNFNIPGAATAYSGSIIVAKAKSVSLPIPNSGSELEVEETYLDPSGHTIYRGDEVFAVGDSKYIVKSETPIAGTKPFQAFSVWPDGEPGSGSPGPIQ